MGSGIPRSGASTACAAIAGVLAPIALTLAADQPSQKTVLERGGANVAAMAAALPTIVATETFDQTLRGQGVAESSRRLVAEFAWVRVPGDVALRVASPHALEHAKLRPIFHAPHAGGHVLRA